MARYLRKRDVETAAGHVGEGSRLEEKSVPIAKPGTLLKQLGRQIRALANYWSRLGARRAEVAKSTNV